MFKRLGQFTLGMLCCFLVLFAGNSKANLPIPNPTAPSMLTGLYTSGFVGNRAVLEQEVQAVDALSQQHSLVGIFIDLEARNPEYDIPTALNQLRNNGYTGFVNFTSRRSAAAIASGQIDQNIAKMAKAYRAWAENVDEPLTFIAPLPEMNGAWETYGQTPEQFKQAYHHIQSIFTEEGVANDSVRWVFAPNGWSEPAHRFEQYYPGDDTTDIVAFSAYNWGYCNNASWKAWQTPDTVFGSYISRMEQMAADKPIFIAQTATTSMTQSGEDPSAKDEWLKQTYQYLQEAGVRGVMYFNIEKECDWAVHAAGSTPASGYQQALTHPNIQYQSPEAVKRMFSR